MRKTLTWWWPRTRARRRFSDIANALSAEYGFWLGDAFASGGSVGYDHKKMGITAQGCLGLGAASFPGAGSERPDHGLHRVVGIGDMAGDVFGNGMLCSPHISSLVAAFNHLHIFIDPEPDAAITLSRSANGLFVLPRSGWCDYDCPS